MTSLWVNRSVGLQAALCFLLFQILWFFSSRAVYLMFSAVVDDVDSSRGMQCCFVISVKRLWLVREYLRRAWWCGVGEEIQQDYRASAEMAGKRLRSQKREAPSIDFHYVSLSAFVSEIWWPHQLSGACLCVYMCAHFVFQKEKYI